MKKLFKLVVFVALLALVFGAPGSAPAQASPAAPVPHLAGGYAMVDLGTLGGSWSTAVGINSLGEIAGTSALPGDTVMHAFITSVEGGGLYDLGTLGGDWSTALGMSRLGGVTGSSTTATGEPHAFYWTSLSSQPMVDLGTLGGAGSYPNDIDGWDLIVGSSVTAEGDIHAFFWDSADQDMIDLGTLGGTISHALAVNYLGQVVGISDTFDGDTHAFIWDSVNGMTDLGTLGGTISMARDINYYGQVVGYSTTPDGKFHAFLWDSVNGMTDLGVGLESIAVAINSKGRVIGSYSNLPNVQPEPLFIWDSVNGMTDLGTLGGPGVTVATALNPQGKVIGSSSSASGTHAFVWDHVNGMTDLGTLGGGDSEALAIDYAGQIVGRAQTASGDFHAFLAYRDITPPVVTVPGGMMLLGATSPAGAVVTFTATATDENAPPNPAVTCFPASGSLFPLGLTTVTCLATDAAGNTGMASFDVTVLDTTPPALNLPADMVVSQNAPTGAVVNFSATATDQVDGSVAVTCVPASGSTFPLGTTTVNCSATDVAGNTTAGWFDVTVNAWAEAVFASNGRYDGYLRELNRLSGTGGLSNYFSSLIYIGDSNFRQQQVGLLHFDTSALPDGAVVVGVSIQMKLQNTNGVNPFTTHGSLLVDIASPFFGTLIALQPPDFQAVPDAAGVGTFNPVPLAGDWYTADLGNAAFPFLNLTGPTQFRIGFSLGDDGDNVTDSLGFHSGNTSVMGNRPVLIVHYYVP